MLLEISRDMAVFGTYRAVTRQYYKKAYRIKNGLVQVKHAGKWVEVEERKESDTNYLLKYYLESENGIPSCGMAVMLRRTYAEA